MLPEARASSASAGKRLGPQPSRRLAFSGATVTGLPQRSVGDLRLAGGFSSLDIPADAHSIMDGVARHGVTTEWDSARLHAPSTASSPRDRPDKARGLRLRHRKRKQRRILRRAFRIRQGHGWSDEANLDATQGSAQRVRFRRLMETPGDGQLSRLRWMHPSGTYKEDEKSAAKRRSRRPSVYGILRQLQNTAT